jgi:multidrug efflux system membrane fusion protein
MIKSVFTAVVIAIIAFLWIASGAIQKDSDDLTQAQTTPEEGLQEKDIPTVQVRNLTSEVLKDKVTVTGRTQAARQVYVSSETAGQIATLSVEKGDLVKKGDVLAKLEIKDRAARVREAEQLIKQRQIQYDAAKKLSEQGFSSDVRVAESRAQLETAKAQLKQANVELGNIVIRAPFDGVINDKMIEVGDYVTNGTQLFNLVDLNPIEITAFLTEKQLVKIEEDSPAMIELLDGRTVDGTVSFIASAADPETRTFVIEVTAENEGMAIKEGLTAKIFIPTKEVQAYRISPSILSLADDGTVGVKTVSKDNIVRFVPIRLLKDTKEFLWIGGLPDEISLITVGQEFVIRGQQVEPVPEGSTAR